MQEHSYSGLNQGELFELSRELTSKVFSPDEAHMSAYIPTYNNYFYFPGSHFFEYGAIDGQMVDSLRCGAKMLSVGSGDGHLERLLRDGFGVSSENIVVSDIVVDPALKGEDFDYFQFDMLGEWPDFNEKFDYILFPESLGVATMRCGADMTYRFREDVESAVQLIEKTGGVGNFSFFNLLMGSDSPSSVVIYDTIRKSIDCLSDAGSICVLQGVDPGQPRAYVMNKIKSEFADAKFVYDRNLFRIDL